jgi:hypothetical protein
VTVKCDTYPFNDCYFVTVKCDTYPFNDCYFVTVKCDTYPFNDCYFVTVKCDTYPFNDCVTLWLSTLRNRWYLILDSTNWAQILKLSSWSYKRKYKSEYAHICSKICIWVNSQHWDKAWHVIFWKLLKGRSSKFKSLLETLRGRFYFAHQFLKQLLDILQK